jgi:hypothetical protein
LSRTGMSLDMPATGMVVVRERDAVVPLL